MSKKLSKFLSLVLRHKPETIGIELDENGWTDVNTLVEKFQENGHPEFTVETLVEIVETNDKKRFAFSEDNSKIRASQGHSIQVDLNYEPKSPPKVLYHGTALRNCMTIQQEGLKAMNRHHVHLTENIDTAKSVGRRFSKDIEVFKINTTQMVADGWTFYCSDNNVWLVGAVPPQYLDVVINEENYER